MLLLTLLFRHVRSPVPNFVRIIANRLRNSSFSVHTLLLGWKIPVLILLSVRSYSWWPVYELNVSCFVIANIPIVFDSCNRNFTYPILLSSISFSDYFIWKFPDQLLLTNLSIRNRVDHILPVSLLLTKHFTYNPIISKQHYNYC